MSRGQPSSRPSDLQLALERGLHSPDALWNELQLLGEAVVQTEEEAQAVCQAAAMLASLPERLNGKSPLADLVRLFESVRKRNRLVYRIVAERGIPSLVSIVKWSVDVRTQGNSSGPNHRDILAVLAVLARFRTRAGTAAILRAARVHLDADSYRWHSILGEFARHPHRKWLYSRLSAPVPRDFIGISLLDSANVAHNRGAQGVHPFSSLSGITRLRELILDDSSDGVSSARSAVYAIPFLNRSAEDELLSLAFDHPSAEVQLEAALAAAKMGRGAGLRALSRACLDANLSDRAKFFLEQLGQDKLIPAAANDEHFVARATFANWLAHPCELGCPPDEVEIVDHRMLRWPPGDELKPFWLVKYRVRDRNGLLRDDSDTGLVGSMTFCLFSYKLSERPPEDAYAIHCYWELTHSELIVESSGGEGEDYVSMLSQYPGADLREVELETVCELSARLNYPQQLVGIASCRRGDEPGWVILDGPRSRFYAAAEMPRDSYYKCVLMLHVGRGLLGFGYEANRQAFLQTEPPPRDSAQFVQSYERLLERERTRSKPCEFGILTQTMDEFVDALCHLRELSKPSAVSIVYMALIEIADNWDPKHARDVCGHFSPLADHFTEQVETLVSLDRPDDVLALISRFRVWWDAGEYLPLAKAALRIGRLDMVQEMLQQVRSESDGWCSNHVAVGVAELWLQLGDRERAKSELMAVLVSMRDENRNNPDEGSKDCIEGWFQDKRAAYLRLFPEQGEAELTRQGIPASTLPEPRGFEIWLPIP